MHVLSLVGDTGETATRAAEKKRGPPDAESAHALGQRHQLRIVRANLGGLVNSQGIPPQMIEKKCSQPVEFRLRWQP